MWVVQITSPVLRCHHISGSSKRDRTVRVASTIRRLANITGNENNFCKTPERTRPTVGSMVSDAVLMLYRIRGHLGRRGYLPRVDQQAESTDGDKRVKSINCVPRVSCSRCVPALLLPPTESCNPAVAAQTSHRDD